MQASTSQNCAASCDSYRSFGRGMRKRLWTAHLLIQSYVSLQSSLTATAPMMCFAQYKLHGNVSDSCMSALLAQVAVSLACCTPLPANKQHPFQAGHPQSTLLAHRFCRQHHYDDNALFQHMHSRHEHCFICRRRQPQKYVYYRDLEELAGEHPSCVA